MNAVIGLTDLLLDTKLDGEQRDFVETIRSSSDILLTIINEILDFSKIEAGEIQLEKVNFNLTNCVEQIAEVLGNNAYSKGIELSCRIDPNIPNHLQGDPTKLSQVLTNLIGNAIKFTERGGVSIDISAIATTDRQTTLYFQVQDTGIGISPESHDKIFHPFSQADSSTTRQYGGTGLGLSISKRLIELMGGDIGTLGALGSGSTFWFTLTCNLASTSKSDELALAQRLRQVLQGQRLLVVGKWEHGCLAIEAAAKYYGALVMTAATSAEAIELLTNAAASGKPFQLLVTDLTLPDCPTIQLPKQIQKYPELANLLIVATIAYGESDRARSLLAKSIISSYLFKPAKPLSILNKLVELQAPTNGQKLPSSTFNPHSPQLPAQSIDSNLSILVAEDNKVNQKVALNQLKNLGYIADLACDGEEVLTRIAERHYDVILMDCHMPRLDGYAATRAIRLQEGDSRHTIVIALTASAMKEDLELAMAAGMDDFLSKPVRKEELAAKISQWTTPKQPPLNNPPPVDKLAVPVDFAYLHQLSQGDTEFEQTILRIFVDSTQEQLQILSQALIRRDLVTIQHSIHEIRGASANVGAVEIDRLANRLEELVAVTSDLPSQLEIRTILSKIEHLTKSIESISQ